LKKLILHCGTNQPPPFIRGGQILRRLAAIAGEPKGPKVPALEVTLQHGECNW